MDDGSAEAAELLENLRKGSQVALGRAISHVESGGETALALLDLIHAHTGAATRIGVTGPPGTGKSTLVSAMTASLRARPNASSVAIVAIDPSSPFTGGALLGDRFRMHEISDDKGVFIRSMASRGALGGLSEATEAACDVLEAAGYPTIIVETVGVGQNEVDIASACDTTILVLNPEGGDTIQGLKAGLMEVADIIVVNKADHARTARFLMDLGSALEVRQHGPNSWIPPVLKTIATQGDGVPELLKAIDDHRAFLTKHGMMEEVREQRLRRRLKQLWLALLGNHALESPRLRDEFDRLLAGVAARSISPYRAARDLLDVTLEPRDEARFSEETLGQAIAADRHPESSDFKPPRADGRDKDTRKHLGDLGPKK
ncbi:MAG: methylmalonyl Co-A mutase-associated GTPase MeaB [Planctomycetes bacterium]|nr:methylmalonyl Co-A mutase-associated GTPase MeaB [Planctomycetota bacterium]NUQ34907.1 methylmalonyl Co-A mutase-associated GTPase MeaB [Planctomycetaceae bacterium]